MVKERYDFIMNNMIDSIKSTSKPTLLLHVCCGPCSTSVIELLKKYFDVTLYYYNPNTYPKDEYDLRLNELKRFVSEVKLDIKIIEGKYDTQKYFSAISGYEDYPEGSVRCDKCIKLRMEESAIYAKENGFEYFTTTLSVSPMKNADSINLIGLELQDKYGVLFLVSDFKKHDGYKKSVELSKKYNLYRQTYCGCQMSKK